MTIYTVLSLDMWGHVGADCMQHGCPCVVTNDPNASHYKPECEDGVEMHDDDRCDCHEDCNAQYRAGAIEVDENADDKAILTALHAGHFLSDKGLRECVIDDYTDGTMLDVNDQDGRRILALQTKEPP